MDEVREAVPAQGGAVESRDREVYTMNADAVFGPMAERPSLQPSIQNWLASARIRFEPLRKMRYRDFNDEEWDFFLCACFERGLNPMTNQICARLAPGVSGETEVQIIVQIAALRAMAIDSGCHGGAIPPVFDYTDTDTPVRATKTVYRMIGGERVAFEAEALWHNFYPGPGTLWDKMPEVCLGTCAEAAAIRQAFPERTGGVYVAEEMMRAARGPRRAPVMAAPSDGEPGSPRALEEALLHEFNITDPAARAGVVRSFREAGSIDDDRPEFYAQVYRIVKSDPETYGGKRAETATA
jgi:hypothetical protein